MKYAIKDDIKIKAAKSGEIAKCPLCKSNVKAYCGSLVDWHWKHISKKDCDSWWEPETEWHRNWKDNFPEKWQEIVCFDAITGEKHIADIKTDRGITVEFQNSPISIEELRQRESFYENLIWVINAEKFKDNFILKSMVMSKIRNLESQYSSKIKMIEKKFDDKIKEKEKFIMEKKNILKILENKILELKLNIEKFQKYRSDYIYISSKIIDSILNITHYSNFKFHSFIKETEKIYKNNLLEIIRQQDEFTKKCTGITKKINIINELCYDDNILYKIIPNDIILKITNHSKILYIDKHLYESNLLFKPELERVANEYQLETMLRNGEKFIFYYDFRDDLSAWADEKKFIEKEINKFKILFDKKSKCISIKFYDWLSYKINVYENELKDANKDILDKSKLLAKEQEELCSLIANINSEKQQQINLIEKQKETEKFKIMKENKGLYTFIWKYPRKVWIEASCKLYFDTGEDFLLYCDNVKSLLFKKITKNDFISKLCQILLV